MGRDGRGFKSAKLGFTAIHLTKLGCLGLQLKQQALVFHHFPVVSVCWKVSILDRTSQTSRPFRNSTQPIGSRNLWTALDQQRKITAGKARVFRAIGRWSPGENMWEPRSSAVARNTPLHQSLTPLGLSTCASIGRPSRRSSSSSEATGHMASQRAKLRYQRARFRACSFWGWLIFSHTYLWGSTWENNSLYGPCMAHKLHVQHAQLWPSKG